MFKLIILKTFSKFRKKKKNGILVQPQKTNTRIMVKDNKSRITAEIEISN